MGKGRLASRDTRAGIRGRGAQSLWLVVLTTIALLALLIAVMAYYDVR